MQDENLGIHQFSNIILINQHILRSMIKEAISRKVVGKKAPKCMRQDQKGIWVFTGILLISLDEMY